MSTPTPASGERSTATRILRGSRVVACLGLVALAACGSDGRSADGPSDATPEAAAAAYAEAFLHGTPDDYLALWSETCDQPEQPISAAAWEQQQEQIGEGLGVPVSEVEVTGAEVRDETESTASATATYDLSESVAGNDNWIPFVKEAGRWRVANCTLLPIGGQSTSGKASD